MLIVLRTTSRNSGQECKHDKTSHQPKYRERAEKSQSIVMHSHIVTDSVQAANHQHQTKLVHNDGCAFDSV